MLQQRTKRVLIFKPGARRPQAGVRLVSRNHFHAAKVRMCVCVCVCVCMCMCVCVCVCPPPRL